jgi:hypothetical protein
MSLQLPVRDMATALPPIQASTQTRAMGIQNGGRKSDVLERIGTRMVLRRRRSLFQEGDDADAVYRVVSGAVRASRVMPTAGDTSRISCFMATSSGSTTSTSGRSPPKRCVT